MSKNNYITTNMEQHLKHFLILWKVNLYNVYKIVSDSFDYIICETKIMKHMLNDVATHHVIRSPWIRKNRLSLLVN